MLAWNGHVDVVPPGDEREWTDPPFEGRTRDGRLWGRGAVDMKGSVACALAAVETIAAAGLRLEGEVLFLVAADEETGGHLGTAHLVSTGAARGADAAICGEATGLNLFVAAKGLLWLEIVVRGRACHASQPDGGVNAIAGMAHILEALARWRSRVPEHPLVGSPTLVPTVISGGIKENIIPDECRVRVDRRLLPGETVASATSEVEDLLDEVRHTHGLVINVEEITHWAASEIDAFAEIVEVAQSAVRAVTGSEPAIGGSTGATDARHLINSGNVPTLILGPGSIDQAHTVDEWVATEQLELATLVFADIFCKFLGWSEVTAEEREHI